MAGYVVLEDFYDLRDAQPCGVLSHAYHEYRAGDGYPRAGYEPTPERIQELLSDTNARGRALIAARAAGRKRKGGGSA